MNIQGSVLSGIRFSEKSDDCKSRIKADILMFKAEDRDLFSKKFRDVVRPNIFGAISTSQMRFTEIFQQYEGGGSIPI